MQIKNLFLCIIFVYSFNNNALPLFERFAELKQTIPYVELANLPTPIERCNNLEKKLHHNALYIKRDDLTGHKDLYGGNKVRKLEFLLGDALQKQTKKVITFGCVGTNHGLATACYCKQLGLNCLLMLKHQPNSPVVRQNLLLDHYFNADIKLFANNAERRKELDILLEQDNDLYFIPTGGSVPLGILGFVNAALELKEEISQGIIPEPDYIYLPIGSTGTTVGLLLGFQLAKIKSKIIAVAVEPEEKNDEFLNTSITLFAETNRLLNQCCSEIPLFDFPHDQLSINKEFCGIEYGLWLRCVDDAARLMDSEERIRLEGTYSAKTLAAVTADIKNNKISRDDVILLWNTYCGLDFSSITQTMDYKELNSEVHKYFEDAQLIDIQKINPKILLDLKFATADNFTGEILYPKYKCLLLKPVAENLCKAAKEFENLGYTIKIWDGYRPPAVSAKLWDIMPDENFIANPYDGGSRHNRGCAIDLTLVDRNGKELDMGTCFCHFTEKAFRNYQNLPDHVLKNRKFLESVMEKHGFIGLRTEWWHFDYKDWLQYPIIDVSLNDY